MTCEKTYCIKCGQLSKDIYCRKCWDQGGDCAIQ